MMHVIWKERGKTIFAEDMILFIEISRNLKNPIRINK